MGTGPLAGIKVVDVSGAVAGPWAASWLAEQGAGVIFVEKVGIPDVMRLTGAVVGDQSGTWVQIHRNKRGIDLDLRQERGRDILLSLTDSADVFIQNFRPGVVDRLGIGYDDVSARNPDIVYLSVSGFGPDGPLADQPVYDPIIQARTGMAEAQNGDYVRAVVADKTAAMTGANAVLAALLARERGSGGQHVEVNLLDSMLAWMFVESYWNLTLPDAEATPTYTEWYMPWDTADGQIAANWTNFTQYQAACITLGRPELADDPRFATRSARIRNAEAQREELAATLTTLTTEEALAALRAADVPSAPVQTREQIFDDPQVAHNQTILEVDHPIAGRTRTARPPARYSRTPTAIERPAPGKGEHTDEILAELGHDEATIAELRAGGVVG